MKPSATPQVDTRGVLERAQALLDEARPEAALKLLPSVAPESPALMNARGVCLLRMGRRHDALRLFREIAMPAGSFSVPNGTPTVFQVNYATALLLAGSLPAAMEMIEEIPDKTHPALVQLAGAVRRWKRSLPWWSRMLLAVGLYPDAGPALDFPPGSLWQGEDGQAGQAPGRAT